MDAVQEAFCGAVPAVGPPGRPGRARCTTLRSARAQTNCRLGAAAGRTHVARAAGPDQPRRIGAFRRNPRCSPGRKGTRSCGRVPAGFPPRQREALVTALLSPRPVRRGGPLPTMGISPSSVRSATPPGASRPWAGMPSGAVHEHNGKDKGAGWRCGRPGDEKFGPHKRPAACDCAGRPAGPACPESRAGWGTWLTPLAAAGGGGRPWVAGSLAISATFPTATPEHRPGPRRHGGTVSPVGPRSALRKGAARNFRGCCPPAGP